METKLEGQKAISMLNGRQVEGRVLQSMRPGPGSLRRRRRSRGGGYGGGGGRGGGGRAAATGKAQAPSRAAPMQQPKPAGSTRSCRFFCENSYQLSAVSFQQRPRISIQVKERQRAWTIQVRVQNVREVKSQ